MGKSKKNSNAIVAINRATQSVFGLRDNEIFPFDFDQSKSNNTFVSYIPFKDMVTTTVEISRSVEDADLLDAIVIKVYEELGLDATLDYKITYLEILGSTSENRVFNVFVVDGQILTANFDAIAARTNYIDYIALAPFLYEGLYKRNLLTKDTTDCFIYLQNDDAFMVVYQNGEYFQSRQIRYNLKFIQDKFCQLIGNRIDEKTFAQMLSINGINLENQVERDYMIQIFDEMFSYINDIINSMNKIYNIKIQNIFFGTDIGKISGVEIFVEDTLKLTYKDFNFSVAVNMKDYPEITQLDILMFLVAQDYLVEQNDDHNYSPFRRPPPFSKRPAGKVLSYLAAGVLVGLLYPAYQYAHGYYMEMVTNQKTSEWQEIDREVKQLQDAIKDLETKISATRKDIEKENKILTDRKTLLEGIHTKKVDYAKKAVGIYNLSQLVNKNRGNVVYIKDMDRNLTISVQTATDKQMTNLLKDISAVEPYAVYTRSIVLNEDNKTIAYYDSNITVEMR